MFPEQKVFEQRLHGQNVLEGVVKKRFRNFSFRRRIVERRRRRPDGEDSVVDVDGRKSFQFGGFFSFDGLQDADRRHLFLQRLSCQCRQKSERKQSLNDLNSLIKQMFLIYLTYWQCNK